MRLLPSVAKVLLLSIAVTATQRPARFWLDEVFFAPAETFFLRAEIAKSNGSLIISGESVAGDDTKGFSVPQQWDFYYTVRNLCYSVLAQVQWPQRVNCVPGSEAFTLKKTLVSAMQAAYGEDAFHLMPRSYLLPEQESIWRAWAHASRANLSATWVLKTNVHRGKGVHLHSLGTAQQLVQDSLQEYTQVLGAAGRRAGARARGMPWSASKLRVLDRQAYVVAQHYVPNQWVMAGRQCYVRMWAVITSVNPLRLYLYKGGVVIFGDAKSDAAAGTGGSGNHSVNGSAVDQVVNLWRMDRSQSLTWTMGELRAHMVHMYEEHEAAQAPAQSASGKQEVRGRQAATGGERAPGRRGLLDSDGGFVARDIPRATAHLDRAPSHASHADKAQRAAHHHVDGGRRLADADHPAEAEVTDRRRGGRGAGGGEGRRAGRRTGADGQGAQRRRSRQPQPQSSRSGSAARRNPGKAFSAMWDHMRNVIGLAVAASLPHMRHAARNVASLPADGGSWSSGVDGSGGLGPDLGTAASLSADDDDQPPSSHQYTARAPGYELLGVDFLLDAGMNAHLLEINSLPSMAGRDTCGDRAACSLLAQQFAAEELERLSKPRGEWRRAHSQSQQQPQQPQQQQQQPQQQQQHARSMAGEPDPRPTPFRDKFALQKHGAVHDMLGLLGMPVHPSGPSAKPATHPSWYSAPLDVVLQGPVPQLMARHRKETAASQSGARQGRRLTEPTSAEMGDRESDGSGSIRAGAGVREPQGQGGFSLDGLGDEWMNGSGAGTGAARALQQAAKGRRRGGKQAPAEHADQAGQQPGYGATDHGSGAVLLLAAALVAQVQAPAGSSTATGTSSGTSGGSSGTSPGTYQLGNATAVISALGSYYPRALAAAELLLPDLWPLLCPGLAKPPSRSQQDDGAAGAASNRQRGRTRAGTATRADSAASALVPACAAGCVWLGELQVVGELEMELSSRGQYQPIYPLQEAVELNGYMLTAAGERQQPKSWLQAGLGGLWGGHPASRLYDSRVRASVRLHMSHEDRLTLQAAGAHQVMRETKELRGCTDTDQAAARCALRLMQRIVELRCREEWGGVTGSRPQL